MVNLEGDAIISDFFSQSKLATHEIFQLVFTSKKSVSKPIRPTASPVCSIPHICPEYKYRNFYICLNCSYENRPIDNRQMLVFQQTARQNLSVEEKHYKMKNLKRSASESKRVAPTPPPSEQGGGIVRSHTVSVRDRSLLGKKIETRTQVRVLKNAFLLLRWLPTVI